MFFRNKKKDIHSDMCDISELYNLKIEINGLKQEMRNVQKTIFNIGMGIVKDFDRKDIIFDLHENNLVSFHDDILHELGFRITKFEVRTSSEFIRFFCKNDINIAVYNSTTMGEFKQELLKKLGENMINDFLKQKGS